MGSIENNIVPFTSKELECATRFMKFGKAAELGQIQPEPLTSNVAGKTRISNNWKMVKVALILKSGNNRQNSQHHTDHYAYRI